MERINSDLDWNLEGLKLLSDDSPFDGEKVWGFTKVENDKEATRVVEALKKISSNFPDLTWIIFDEGKNVRLKMKNGIALGAD